MNFTYLATIIGANLETYVFGTPELLGIFSVLLLIFLCWRFGLGMDGALVIIGFGIIALSGNFLLPEPNLWRIFIFLGILAGIGFIWFARFFRA